MNGGYRFIRIAFARTIASAATLMVSTLPFGVGPVEAQIPAPPQDHPIALTGGTINTVTNGVIPNGTIVFENGIITAVGTDVEIPSDAERVDVSGRHVYPGMVDGNSAMGLFEIGGFDVTIDLDELGTITPNVRAEVAVNPESRHIGVARSHGVLVTVSSPQGGLISGQAAAMMLDGWTWEEMTLESGVGMIVNWPSPNEEEEGEYVSSIRELRDALTWAEEEDVRIVIRGGRDAPYVADHLAAKGIPVMITSVLTSPSRQWEPYDSEYILPAQLFEAGVRFAIVGGSNVAYEYRLPHEAGTAVAFGLPEDEALKAVTLYPAEFLGFDDRVGSLEVGKDATLLITTGSPLEYSTLFEQAYIEGREIDMVDQQRYFFEKYMERLRQSKAATDPEDS
ncbi:MAG: amidohydrolase family protein [Gemmatimonas sp.]|nr:amidohydrolase family protein [Gemmatimonas sp.]